MSTVLDFSLNFSKARVLTVGDIMLDRYISGDVHRISPEAPVPVLNVSATVERVGGAGNVALNVKSLGAHSTLCGLIGEDQAGARLKEQLASAGIETRALTLEHYQTIVKLRVVARQQQLLRLDTEKRVNDFDSAVLKALSHSLGEYQVLILSDYAKGVIQDPQSLIQLARAKGLKVLVDPKNRDFSVYRGATLVTPNFSEFLAAVGPCHSEAEIQEKAHQLIDTMNFEALLVTRGKDGMTLFTRGQAEGYQISALAREVFDVTGAGDTVIATLGVALGAGMDLLESCRLANVAASLVVARLGTATVSLSELEAAFMESKLGYSSAKGCLSEAELMEMLQVARAHGERIVMTNGCFDILHAGHITYLEQARALGTKLIIAVNDDASVKRLKGEKRPINCLKNRMRVLSALGCVDWVVSFSEDTPQRLIEAVLPDVLVKGGDYQISEIAGAEAVLAHGGDVKILGFVEGLSTTRLIEQLQLSEASLLETI